MSVRHMPMEACRASEPADKSFGQDQARHSGISLSAAPSGEIDEKFPLSAGTGAASPGGPRTLPTLGRSDFNPKPALL